MSSYTPLKRPGEDDIVNEAGPPKKARTTAPTPSASPPSTTNAHPATPPQTLLPGLGMSGSGGSVTFPTPPSTAGFHSHMVGPGSVDSGGNESEQQTPAGEAIEGVPKAEDGEVNATTDAKKMEDLQEAAAQHRRTDHEREEGESKPFSSAAPPGLSSAVAVPSLYKVSKTPIPLSDVSLTTNLLSLYSLNTLQSTVARRDPVTGEKINPLRKHYGNKVKSLGLEGKDRPLKRPGELFGLVDPGWDMVVDGSKNLWQVQREEALLEKEGDEDGVLGKLESALGGMGVGHLPRKEHEEWRSLLGLDDATTAAAVPVSNATSRPVALPASSTRPAPHAPASAVPAHVSRTAPAAAARASAPASPSRTTTARPERTGKKRRYDESSYEGYEEDGYSTAAGGAGDDGAGTRRGSIGKRVKVSASGSSAAGGGANGGGGTMVGVRSS